MNLQGQVVKKCSACGYERYVSANRKECGHCGKQTLVKVKTRKR